MNSRTIGAHLPLESQFDLHLQLMVDRGCERKAYDKFARVHGRKLSSIAGRFHQFKAKAYYESADMAQLVLGHVWNLLQAYEYRCSGESARAVAIGPGARCSFRTKALVEWRAHVVVFHGGQDVQPQNDVGRFIRIGIRRAMIKETSQLNRHKRFMPESWDDAEALDRARGGYESHVDERIDAHTILERVGEEYGEESRDMWAGRMIERGRTKAKAVTATARRFAEAV